MKVTVKLPNGTSAIMDVADGYLVLDADYDFVQPKVGTYITLLIGPNGASFTTFAAQLEQELTGLVDALNLQVTQYYLCKITDIDATPTPTTDPQIIAAPDPTGGVCVCGITCWGPNLKYVQVYPLH